MARVHGERAAACQRQPTDTLRIGDDAASTYLPGMPHGAPQTSLFDDPPPAIDGVALLRGFAALDAPALLDAMLPVLAAAPPYHLQMRTGAQMINRVTNCGLYGWHSDARGYRYVTHHPATDAPWPAIPTAIRDKAVAAARLAGAPPFEPDACLVNFYEANGRLNLHQDRDEADFRWPIVSFSFGNDAVFVLGGEARKDAAQPITLHHGDVLVLHGPARRRFHGVKAIVPATAPLDHPAIPPGGRLNLTLRRAK